MKISCPSCSAKYSIADEKVQNRLAKIRCRKCGTSIVIDGNVSPANVYAADAAGAAQPAAAPAGTMYSVDLGENDQRQMGLADLVTAYNNGTVTAETYVWADGFADWITLGQVEEIVEALHQAANAEAPTPLADETSAAAASAMPEESPWEAPAAAEPAPAAAPSPAAQPGAAAPAPSGGGPDLFGNVAQAGSEGEAASYTAPAASPAQSASPFGGASASAAGTGARNESSVLFSLSALTSGAQSSRPSVPPAAASGSEDSGLIDLKALTESAEAASAAQAPAPSLQSPLAAPSPLGAPAAPLGVSASGASIAPQQQQRSNLGLYIAGGIVIAAVAVASIITFGGSSTEPVAAPAPPVSAPAVPSAAAAPAPLPTAAPAPLPSAEATEAQPPATGKAAEPAPKAKAAPTVRPKSYPKPKSTSSPKPSSSPSPKPAAKPAPKPKSSMGKCGCRKDDLMCLMNCAQ